jgi:programmed cell death protein 5
MRYKIITVSRIALVSPDRSKQIESVLLRMAQSGQLRGQVTEKQLIELLEQVPIMSSGLRARVSDSWSRWKKLKEDQLRKNPQSWCVCSIVP